MWIVTRFCFLISVCSVFELYKRFLLIFLGFLRMDCASFLKPLIQTSDFECGFLVFGCFSRVFNLLVLFLVFCVGLKILQFGFCWRRLVQFLCHIRGRSSHINDGLGSKIGFGEDCDSKIMSCKCGPLKFLENSKSQSVDTRAKAVLDEDHDEKQNVDKRAKDVLEIDHDEKKKFDGRAKDVLEIDHDEKPIVDKRARDVLEMDHDEKQTVDKRAKDVLEIDHDEKDCYGEDLEFDVMALRRLVKIERQRASMAYMELEKERMAAASAADEAMAMFLRLQNDKSATEIEANQYRRWAEQKQKFDKEQIQSLQWIVMKHESDRIWLEEKFMSLRQKLKQYVKDDELDDFEGVDASINMFNSTMEEDVDDEVISSVDQDSYVL